MLNTKIGIDIGTRNITCYVKGKGIVLSQSTAVCYDSYSDEIIAVGNSAGEMPELTPDSLLLVRPIKDGVIADFTVMRTLLTMIIDKLCKNKIFRPSVVISAPSSMTAPEKKTIIDVVCAAGAGKAAVIEEPVAAALGAGISIDEPRGTLVVDIGAGTSDIAVITMGCVCESMCCKTAGDSFDEAIMQYLKRERDILIGMRTAERIKIAAASAVSDIEDIEVYAAGKNYVSGRPVSFSVTSSELFETVDECVGKIADGIRQVLERIPAELYTDICHTGIYLTGAGAKLRGLEKAMKSRFNIPVRLAQDSQNCAAKGAGYSLRHLDRLEDLGVVYKLKHD